MRLKVFLCFGLIGVLLTTGCASIMSGPMQQIRLNSYPERAEVRIDGQVLTTPAVATVPRKSPALQPKFTKEGFKPATIIMSKGFNFWTLGNVIWGLFGFFIGSGVDAGTGAMFTHEPNIVNVTLVEE